MTGRTAEPSATRPERGLRGLPTIHRWRGPRPGATIALLGGVHGDEAEGVLAVREVARRVAASGIAGELRWAAPASPGAWAAMARLDPSDGGNLARSFPGASGGSVTERAAAALTAELIAGSDLVIDLHSAGSGNEMPTLCGYLASGPLAGRAAGAAAEFAAEFTWRHPDIGPGRSISTATELGIPSIYAECRGGGRIRAADVQDYVDGTCRVLRASGLLPTAPPPRHTPVVVRGDGNTDDGVCSPVAGLLVAEVDAGDIVAAGAVLARVVDDDGATLHEFSADRRCAVMMLRRSIRVTAGDTVVIVAAIEDDGR